MYKLFFLFSNKMSCQNPNWPSFGRDFGNNRNATAERQLSPCNVSNLSINWIFTDPRSGNTGNITAVAIVDDVVYFGDVSAFFALNADTGSIIWQNTSFPPNSFFNLSPSVGTVIVYQAASNGTVYALKRSDGTLVWQTDIRVLPAQANGAIDGSVRLIESENILLANLASSAGGNTATVDNSKFYGSVVALNATTGALIWRYQTTLNPIPGLPNSGTYPGVGLFSTGAIDISRGLFIIGTGQNFSPPFPALPPLVGTQLSDSILALNYRTTNPSGELVWFNQFTNNDVDIPLGPPALGSPFTVSMHQYDWDVSGGPYLLRVCINRETKDIAVIGDKSGKIYAVDRNNGQLVWKNILTAPPPTGYLATGPTYPLPSSNVTFPVNASNNGGVNGYGCTDGKFVYIASTFSATGAPIPSSYGLRNVGATVPPDQIIAETSIFSVRAGDGKIMWRVNVVGMSLGGMAYANGVVYIIIILGNAPAPNNAGANFYALDASSGKILYNYIYSPDSIVRRNGSFGAVTVYKGKVYVPFGNFTSNGGKTQLYAFGL